MHHKNSGGSLIGLLLFALLWALPVLAQDLTPDQRAKMQQADIVLLGEIHDNPHHHQGQAALLRHIAPKAVVFEMLSPAQAQIMNRAVRDDWPALAQQIDWGNSGWPAFSLYEPIFAALKDLPIIGAAAPRDQVRAAFEAGAAATFGAGAEAFDLNTPLPSAERRKRMALQFEAHCAAMPLEMMDGMVEAQRFRDARFSEAALTALKTHGAPIIVIAGNGHVRRDWGMPALIAKAAPSVTTYAIGFVESPNPGNDPRYDVTIVTQAAARNDPCAAFD